MRSARLILPLVFLLISLPVCAQQTQQTTTPPTATKDPQAVSVVNQALTVAGGATAISAITDYSATGNVTYHWNPEAQGSVTILGLRLTQVRVDANLPLGLHSQIVSDGKSTTKAEDGRVTQYPPPYPVPSSDAYPYQPPMFPGGLVLPHAQLVAVLNSPRYNIFYKGLTQVDGNSVHDIQVQRVLPGKAQSDGMLIYHTMDFFIDANTLQVVMTQDNVPKNVVHQIRYSAYTQVSGVLVPFSLSEQMGGQKTRDIQLGRINFNTGLQDSAFAVQ